MALFRCGKCNKVYEDHYPPDDTCTKCKQGFVRIINEADLNGSASFHFKEIRP